MGVMAAGVHVAGVFRGICRPGLLCHLERVDIRPDADRPSAL